MATGVNVVLSPETLAKLGLAETATDAEIQAKIADLETKAGRPANSAEWHLKRNVAGNFRRLVGRGSVAVDVMTDMVYHPENYSDEACATLVEAAKHVAAFLAEVTTPEQRIEIRKTLYDQSLPKESPSDHPVNIFLNDIRAFLA